MATNQVQITARLKLNNGMLQIDRNVTANLTQNNQGLWHEVIVVEFIEQQITPILGTTPSVTAPCPILLYNLDAVNTVGIAYDSGAESEYGTLSHNVIPAGAASIIYLSQPHFWVVTQQTSPVNLEVLAFEN